MAEVDISGIGFYLLLGLIQGFFFVGWFSATEGKWLADYGGWGVLLITTTVWPFLYVAMIGFFVAKRIKSHKETNDELCNGNSIEVTPLGG